MARENIDMECWDLGDIEDEIDIVEACTLTSEIDHLHTCPECGEEWWHANHLCDVDKADIFPQLMTCPNCE